MWLRGCKDMTILKQKDHCNSFWIFVVSYILDLNHTRGYLLLFGATNTDIHVNMISESQNIPTPLYSLSLSSCDFFLLPRWILFCHSLILVIPFAPLHLALVSALPLYPDFISRSVLIFKSLLKVAQPSFFLPIFDILSTSFPLTRQRMLSKWPKHSPISLTSLSTLTPFVTTWKSLG